MTFINYIIYFGQVIADLQILLYIKVRKYIPIMALKIMV